MPRISPGSVGDVPRLSGVLAGAPCHAEVGDHRAGPAGLRQQHHVVALEVTVHDTDLVGGVERVGHLHDERQRFLREHAPRAQPLGQRLAGQELHRDERDRGRGHAVHRRRAVHEEVEDPADVRVRHLPRQERFTLEAGDGPLVLGDLGPDRLQRQVLVQLEIFGLVDLAHAAARHEADDAEAIRDELFCLKCLRPRGGHGKRGAGL